MDKKIVQRSSTKEIVGLHTLLIQEQIQNCEKITISLLEGSAEIFGIELMRHYPHSYSIPCSLPVFSWDRAKIEISWSQYENSLNSENQWVDITAESGNRESAPMMQYLEYHFEMVALRKLALEKIKEGPRIAIVGNANLMPQNIARLLLNYSGKYSMNPIYIDADPESSIFVDGSIGALEFEYKICEDLFDRPDKLCLYYGNRIPHKKSYFDQLKFLIDSITKKIHKEIKEYNSHGTEEEYPFFSNGMIIQCPKIKSGKYAPKEVDQFATIKKVMEICQATHVISVGCPAFLTYLSEKKFKIEKMLGLPLEGAQRFFNLPRPIKSKIERYFDKESKKKIFKIDQIRLFELMTQTEQSPFCSRLVNIRNQAISKNTIAVLHAKINQSQKLSAQTIAERALYSSICCLAHIFSIEQNEITLQVGQQSFMEDFRDNIWVTSVSEQ